MRILKEKKIKVSKKKKVAGDFVTGAAARRFFLWGFFS